MYELWEDGQKTNNIYVFDAVCMHDFKSHTLIHVSDDWYETAIPDLYDPGDLGDLNVTSRREWPLTVMTVRNAKVHSTASWTDETSWNSEIYIYKYIYNDDNVYL